MNIVVEKKHDPKKVYTVVLLSFLAVTVFFALGETGILTPGFWQGIGLLFFCISFFLISKFGFAEYTYTLCDDGFIVIKTMGKKSNKVCHLDLDTVTAVFTPAEWGTEKKSRQITAIYNYNASISPDEYYVVLFELYGKVSAVKFEGTREMYDVLQKIILSLKENQ